MTTVTFGVPEELPSVETPPLLRTTKSESFTIVLPAEARIEHGTGGDDLLLTVRWGEAVVRVIAHREIGVMTVRDYGADMMSVVHLVEPRVRIDRVRWGTLAGSDCAVAHGTTGETDVVAMCAAVGVCRVIVVGSSPAGNADLAAEVESVMTSLGVA